MTVSKNRVNPETPTTSGPAGRRYGGVDSEERQRQRKAKLIDAGLAVFGEQGYHASTVRDVCGKAQLTSRYFYESFDSMEALFKAVYVTINRELMQQTVMALARCAPEPEKLAEAALRTFFEFIRDDPRRARVGLIDAMNVGQSMSDLTGKATQDFAHLIASFMRQMFPRLEEMGLSHQMIADGWWARTRALPRNGWPSDAKPRWKTCCAMHSPSSRPASSTRGRKRRSCPPACRALRRVVRPRAGLLRRSPPRHPLW